MKKWLIVEILLLLVLSLGLVSTGVLGPEEGMLVLILGAGFFGTFNIMPFIIYRMKSRGLVGKDMNKTAKSNIPEMGGTGIIFGFSLAVLLSVFLFSFGQSFIPFHMELAILFAAFSTILLMGFLGVFDDLIGWKKGIRQYQHALIPIFAALPLMAVRAGTSTIAIPIFGPVNFGIFYALILIPIGVTGAANALNILAGMNGLEAGMGALITVTLLLVSIFEQQWEAAIILAAMLGALLAFLCFNWFPAKIFPGDATTLMVGATVATASIIGNMERIGIMLLALYFVELILKGRFKFQAESFGIPQKDGTLLAPKKISSLTHWVMRRGKFTENKVVWTLLAMQVIVCLLVLSYWYLNRIEFFVSLF